MAETALTRLGSLERAVGRTALPSGWFPAALARPAASPAVSSTDSLALLEQRGHRLERLAADYADHAISCLVAGALSRRLFQSARRLGRKRKGRRQIGRRGARRRRAVSRTDAYDRLLEQDARLRRRQHDRRSANCAPTRSWSRRAHGRRRCCRTSATSCGRPVSPSSTSGSTIPRRGRRPTFPSGPPTSQRSGWYGFPALDDGTLKIANHGVGRRVHADDPRRVLPAEEARFRAFVREHLPALANAPIIAARLCLYCDTFDGDFWIAHDPERRRLDCRRRRQRPRVQVRTGAGRPDRRRHRGEAECVGARAFAGGREARDVDRGGTRNLSVSRVPYT